jgi:hypothetical protein
MMAGGAPTPPETCAEKLNDTCDGEGPPLVGPPSMVAFGGVRITNTSISLQAHRSCKYHILEIDCQQFFSRAAVGRQ